MRNLRLISSLIALSTGLSTSAAFGFAKADPRIQVNQRGDFVLFGNTTGYECANNVGVPALPGITINCPNGQGQAITDSAPDIFWRADEPSAGVFTASQTFTAAQARSTAVLNLPPNAVVTYARIYWAGMLATPMSTDNSVLIERPGTALASTVTADDQAYIARGNNSWYQSTADITTILAANNGGAYRVSNIGSVELSTLQSNDPFVGWSIVVFYSLASEEPRNLALFDGLDLVPNGGEAVVPIKGFVVPASAGFTAKLGVVAYEGEAQLPGDSLFFNNNKLVDNGGDGDNFFNGSRSALGVAVSNVGDQPKLTGAPASMAGMDLDVVNVKPWLAAGDTQASIRATSAANNGDTYALGAFVTSIATFKPDFSTSDKALKDLNGGSLLPADIIEYTVTVKNTGNDTAINTILTDALPTGITYVAGSISVGVGATPATFTSYTDAALDDIAEYTAGNRTITVRLGTGAGNTAAAGGKMLKDAAAVVKFKVTVDADAPSSILNQAVINATGEQGAPPAKYPTDGNGPGAGAPPTEAIIDKCASNQDCKAPTAVCDTTPNPNVCVQCLVNADCVNPLSPECLPDHTCGCATGCGDTDGDKIPDKIEVQIGTNPNDADSDDDGVMDGDEHEPTADGDDDKLIDALDPDSDNDGLYDGTELGFDCKGKGTDPSSTHCKADADAGATTTDPLDADTDDGGVKDGSEDLNHDGALDAGETDPTAGHGADDADLKDDDDDGLTNGEEKAIGSDPKDADTDDDGVKDGDEANPSDDTDGDGFINVKDPDSDDDGLKDGTEQGFGCDAAGTDKTRGFCVPDGDAGATTTSPVDPDTDHGGVTDGNEDPNLNGVKDAGETDPTLGHGADDGTLVDTDKDGLSDDLEKTLGTDPKDADSDDDGVKDGDEPNFADDSDRDGKINPLDPDSDDDGLLDGTELGTDCKNGDTDVAAKHCVADADAGATTTNPLDPDTDHGGLKDGDEDANHDGKLDAGERDPNDASDDAPLAGTGGAGGTGGGGAGGAAGTAGAMAAGTAGNGGMAGTAGAAGTSSSAGNAADDGVLEGGGCACRVVAPASSHAPLASLVSILGVLGAAAARRRKRAAKRS